MRIDDSTFFTVHSWMVNKLNLKTTERDVFAILYGFGQDGESDFHGSLSYIATLTGYSRNSICTALKNLTEKKLINKKERIFNNIKYCSYTINFDSVQTACTGVQTACTGVQTALTNNIDDNIVNKKISISKDIDIKNFGKRKLVNNSTKTNLYSRCVSQIDNFIRENKLPNDIRKLLIQHLDIVFENKSIRGEKQYVGILNKLKQLINEGNKYQIVIQYSIEHGYPTFYDRQQKKSYAVRTETGNKHIESFTKEDEEKLYEFQNKLKKEGKRVTF